jgi:AcrR family transcriptional regulator
VTSYAAKQQAVTMSKREQILRASAELIRSQGLTALTTKRVAQEAGCAEGTIFNIFGDKGGLLAAVLSFGLPETQALYAARERADDMGLRDGLVAIISALLEFYEASYPLVASALADRAVFERYSTAHRKNDTGPQQPWQLLTGFLRGHEQALDSKTDVEMVALQVVGACQNAMWIELVSGPKLLSKRRYDLVVRLAEQVVREVS